MADTKSMHERLSDLIWVAQCETDRDVANGLFADAERLALQVLESEPENAPATYAIALTWYQSLAAIGTGELRRLVAQGGTD